jgi:hypothetical protein
VTVLRPGVRRLAVLALAVAATAVALALADPAAAAERPSSPHALGRAASSAPELVVEFEEGEVFATELTPSGDAIFFGLAREPQGAFTRVVRRQGIELVDPFGEARLPVQVLQAGSGGTGGELVDRVPLKSVWAVVDLETGAFGIGAPSGFRLRELPFPGRAFEVGAPGLVNRLRHRFAFVDMMLVRPGVGAWSLRAHDAGPSDHDGADDDRTTTRLDDLEPLGPGGATPTPAAPPDRFAAGDVVVVINPRDLTIYATRLLGPPAAGEGSAGGGP